MPPPPPMTPTVSLALEVTKQREREAARVKISAATVEGEAASINHVASHLHQGCFIELSSNGTVTVTPQ